MEFSPHSTPRKGRPQWAIASLQVTLCGAGHPFEISSPFFTSRRVVELSPDFSKSVELLIVKEREKARELERKSTNTGHGGDKSVHG